MDALNILVVTIDFQYDAVQHNTIFHSKRQDESTLCFLIFQLQGEAKDMDVGEVELANALADLTLVPKELPPPHAPRGRKRDLYYDPSVFTELDEMVFKVSISWTWKTACLRKTKFIVVHYVHTHPFLLLP